MFKNVASQKIAVFAFDTTTGAAKTGDSANITVYINKDWAGVNALTDISATEIDSANAKGWYLFDVSQTETNADALHFTGKSSTANISVVGQLIFTTPANFSTLSVDSNGRVAADLQTIKTQTVTCSGSVTIPAATLASTTNITAGTITTVTNLTNAPTAGDLTSTMKTSVQTAADAAVTANTLVNTIAGYIDTEVAAIKAKTDNLPASPAAVGSAMTLTSAYDFAKGTVAMTEDYAADGAAMTPAQALNMIWSLMAEKNVSSTTLTSKKLDGSTTAMTFTLNDGTSPTGITRAT